MATPSISLEKYFTRIKDCTTVRVRGRVLELTGLVIKAVVPGSRVGEMVRITSPYGAPVLAEVVGFKDETVMLMPLGEAAGIGPDSVVYPIGKPFTLHCGFSLLGHVVNGLGQSLDGLKLEGGDFIDWPVDRPAPDPMARDRVTKTIAMGVRAIDGLLTVGEGQRVGLFAGSGVGKSTLMGQIARNTEAEVVVINLVGERGREVRDFIDESLGVEGLKRSVVVCATSDQPSLVRMKSAFVATAIAEFFRDQGKKVLLMMDSVTRLARAQREIGLAIGEPPARQGYPPSVFAMLPRVLERTGNSDKGSITALYTVLVAGSDMDEPIADEVRSILDGHIILNRALGARNHWPAIDIPVSLSRVMSGIVGDEHKAAASKLREVLAIYEQQRDLIVLGAYQYGTDPKTDWAIDKIEAVETLLRQGTLENITMDETVEQLQALFADS